MTNSSSPDLYTRLHQPQCEYGGRWIVRGMRVVKNGKFSCLRKGCHTVYEARELIDPANEGYLISVG